MEAVGTQAAVAADDAFGADLYTLLGEEAGDTVFSPASIAGALQMVLCGARGETAAELAAALHLDVAPERAADAAADGLRMLAGLVRTVADAGSVTFRVANTVWVQSGLPLLPEFTTRLRDAAAATLADTDFATAPAAARAEINAVIEEQTNGKITGLLPPGAVDRLTRLVLANAVYLKGEWLDQFPAKATKEAPFYPDGLGGASVPVAMMHGTATREYLRADGYQAVLLPFLGTALSMAVVLPDGPLSGLRPRLAAAGLRGLLAGTSRYQVALSLPRFRVETGFDLNQVLCRLGIRRAFDRTADFSGITEAEQLSIGAVAHKAYIDVDEYGAEAAAATAVVMRALAAMRPPPRVDLVVDRPFLVAIIDTTTDLPLFLGQVSKPRTTGG